MGLFAARRARRDARESRRVHVEELARVGRALAVTADRQQRAALKELAAHAAVRLAASQDATKET